MAEKKRPPKTAPGRAAARVANSNEGSVAPPPPDLPDVADLAAQLQDIRDQLELLTQTLDTSNRQGASSSERLAALGEALGRTVEEVRHAKLDREKLLAIASTIAAIARVIGESREG